MKKTYNINISGCAFTIDEDAYDMLDSYLKTLGQICARAGQRETATDIEQRIAEIFTESGDRIITLTDVEGVIDRMGSPEEIVEVEEESSSPAGGAGAAQVPPPFGAVPVQRRLYRDVDHKMLGGVCSGLAWYLGIDVVWIRLIMVALAFISGSVMVVVYIVLWIVVPPAKSPYEKMQMMGVNPSVSNVGKVVTGEYTPGGGAGASVGKAIVAVLSAIGLLLAGCLLLVLSLAFIGCLIAVCVIPGHAGIGGASSVTEARLILGCVTGGSLVAGIPLFLLFRQLLSVLTGNPNTPFTNEQRLFIAIPWLLGVAACVTCGIILGHL